MKKRILIVGLGLIGSSLALCIKKGHPNSEIIGFDNQAESTEFAKKTGLIDEIAESLTSGARRAEIIFLCSPVKATLVQLEELNQLSLETALITDVGSTKVEINQLATKLNMKNFIGGHPMAGSHKSGVTAADERLFENAYYIFTDDHGEKSKQIQELQTLLKGTHAKFITMPAQEHDEITGALSHLPHIVAAALVNESQQLNTTYPRAQQLAAGGFRDITRIASSDATMWTDILLSNRLVLLDLLENWQKEMTTVCQWLTEKNAPAIRNFFDKARETRAQLPIHKEGAIPAFYDLFVDVPDQPGIIAEITQILGEADLSLTNIKILETREEIYGILQLSFKNQPDCQAAKQILSKETNYTCYEK